MGLDLDVFYDLTWYEYLLMVRRHEHIEKEKFDDREAEWFRWRMIAADFKNANRGKSGKVVQYEDLVPLSFDKKKEKTASLSTKQMKELVGGTFKKKDGKQ
jgi:hypothetical protein